MLVAAILWVLLIAALAYVQVAGQWNRLAVQLALAAVVLNLCLTVDAAL